MQLLGTNLFMSIGTHTFEYYINMYMYYLKETETFTYIYFLSLILHMVSVLVFDYCEETPWS